MAKTNTVPSNPKGSTQIAIDAETKALLSKRQEELAGQFGFKPTLSQTLRSVIKVKEDA